MYWRTPSSASASVGAQYTQQTAVGRSGVLLGADAVVLEQLAAVLLPGALGDEERLAVLVRGHRHRLGAAPRDVDVVEQRVPRAGDRAQRRARDLVVLALVGEPLLR